jgi:hypothetical protein
MWVINWTTGLLDNGWLVVSTILKNMKVNGKDDIPYMKWKIKHVPNHQPDIHTFLTSYNYNSHITGYNQTILTGYMYLEGSSVSVSMD